MTRMNKTLSGTTHKAVIYSQPHVCECGRVLHDGRTKFFMTLNAEDGHPREMFLHMDQSGSTLDGMADCVGILISLLLKAGVQLSEIADKLSWQRFDPQGRTENKTPELRTCNSVVDYAVRWAMQIAQEAGMRNQDRSPNAGCLPRRVLQALESAAEELEKHHACDDAECQDDHCNHALQKVRAVLEEQ
jgi:DNA-binding transcriptional MerR regulator